MTKDEALDLALDALDDLLYWDNGKPEYDKAREAITAIKQARALDKMAENARELGLDYEPVAWNAGVPPLYPEMKDGEAISVEYTTSPAAVVNQQLTTQPAAPLQEPPPECQTEAEKRAYAFGWWKALEANRATLVQDQIRAITQEAMQKIYDLEDQVRRKVYNTPAAGEKK
jgi:hypothetical protein